MNQFCAEGACVGPDHGVVQRVEANRTCDHPLLCLFCAGAGGGGASFKNSRKLPHVRWDAMFKETDRNPERASFFGSHSQVRHE